MTMHLETGAMTERDKTLLSVMSIAVVAVLLGWFILRPLIASNLEMNDKITAAEADKAAADGKLSLLDGERALNDTLLENYAAQTKNFYPIMDSTEIDRMLTSSTLERGFSALNLAIQMPSDMTDVAPYPYGAAGLAASENTADTASGVYAVAVTFSIAGEQAALQQYLDDLYADEPAIRIVSYSWSVTNVVGAAGVGIAASDGGAANGQAVLSLSLEIFMTDGMVQTAQSASVQETENEAASAAESGADSLEAIYNSKNS